MRQEHSLVLQTSTRGHTSEWKLLHPASSAEPVLSLTLGRSMAVHQGGGGPATQLRKAKMFSSKRLFEHGGRQFCWRRERLDERHEKFRCGPGSPALDPSGRQQLTALLQACAHAGGRHRRGQGAAGAAQRCRRGQVRARPQWGAGGVDRPSLPDWPPRRSAQPQVSTLQVYELGSLPVPLLVMTAMVCPPPLRSHACCWGHQGACRPCRLPQVMDFERRQATAPAPFAKASLAATT